MCFAGFIGFCLPLPINKCDWYGCMRSVKMPNQDESILALSAARECARTIALHIGYSAASRKCHRVILMKLLHI